MGQHQIVDQLQNMQFMNFFETCKLHAKSISLIPHCTVSNTEVNQALDQIDKLEMLDKSLDNEIDEAIEKLQVFENGLPTYEVLHKSAVDVARDIMDEFFDIINLHDSVRYILGMFDVIHSMRSFDETEQEFYQALRNLEKDFNDRMSIFRAGLQKALESSNLKESIRY